MAKGVYDLPVPDGTSLLTPDALLIPALGVGPQGDRLGYGGGYFDRTLAALHPKPLAVGLAFELSRIATIEPQPHDVLMDFIVTEAGIEAAVAGSPSARTASASLRMSAILGSPGMPAVSLLMKAVTWLSGTAPMKPSAGWPLTKAITAGIDWIPIWPGIDG